MAIQDNRMIRDARKVLRARLPDGWRADLDEADDARDDIRSRCPSSGTGVDATLERHLDLDVEDLSLQSAGHLFEPLALKVDGAPAPLLSEHQCRIASMLHRRLTDTLQAAAATSPIVTLTGPRQSGKTTLVRALLVDHRDLSLEAPAPARHSRRRDVGAPSAARPHLLIVRRPVTCGKRWTPKPQVVSR